MSAFSCTALLLAGSLVLAGCGSAPEPETSTTAAATPATPPAGASSAPRASAAAPFTPLDACTLLTKADVEAMTGKKVLDGRKEELAQLVSCSFGDPTAPLIAGRPLSQIVTLLVTTGDEGAYYAGAVAQVKEILKMARTNAAKAESVSGFGDDAYFDSVFHKLSVVRGKHLVEVDVESGGDSLKVATAIMRKALEKLPD